VPAGGGVSAPVTDLRHGETSHSWPWFLPDGQRFLFLIRSGTPDTTGLYVQGLGARQTSTPPTFLMPVQGRGAIVTGATGGLLLFMREDTVLAQWLDLEGLHLQGEPVSVADAVRTGGENGRNSFSVSENGVMVYRSAVGNRQLRWYTRDGKPAGSVATPGAYGGIELSPNDKKLVVVKLDVIGGADLWLLDLPSSVFSSLITSTRVERDPLWSPDSQRLAFLSADGIHETLVGSGTETTLLAGDNPNLEDWSRDGKTLLFQAGRDVFVLPLEGDKKPQLVFQTPFRKDQFRISPNGHWVTYQTSESGRAEVWVAAFPTFTDRRQVSASGAVMPLWRRDGGELFYVTQDGRFVAVDVKAGGTLDIGPPKVLFQTSMPLNPREYLYAVTSDGQRFLVLEPAITVDVEPLHIVLNWPAALGQ
jgi:eukaryotic-like serine/threonine-protein kinase